MHTNKSDCFMSLLGCFPVLLKLFRSLCRYIRNCVDDPLRKREVLCCQFVRGYPDVLVINELVYDCGAFIGL